MENTNIYQKGKLYKITNDVTDDEYIGSTVQILSNRMGKHRCDSKLAKNANNKFYKLMNEIGFEHFKIILIKLFPCTMIEELRAEEDRLIKELKPSLNSKSAFGFDKISWKEQNKEYILQYAKEHRLANKEQTLEYAKEYRANNKDKIKLEKKEYAEKNKEIIADKMRNWRELNKDKIKEQKQIKIKCNICDCDIRKDDLKRHERSKKHIENMV